jgi:AraC-like DNA-binding protein
MNNRLSEMNAMGYYDDIEFLRGSAVERCLVQLDRRSPDGYSLEFLYSGRMHMAVDGGPRFVLRRPSVFWHHPSRRYKYGSCGPDGWSHHWLVMRGERVRRMLEEELLPRFSDGFAPVSSPELFDAQFHRLLELALSPDRRRKPLATALLEQMLAQIVSDGSEAAASSSGPFEELFESIRLAPARSWDFEALAARAGMSYGNFRRRFKALCGRSPHDFVLQCRALRAAEELARPELAIKELALESGFPDLASFSKFFKARLGVSPALYRKTQALAG